MSPQYGHSPPLLWFPWVAQPIFSYHNKLSTPKNQERRREKGWRRGGLKNEKSVRVGDACPSWIRGTLKPQTEEVILPAGQFENNQCELSRCSFSQDRANGAIVHVSSTKHGTAELAEEGGEELNAWEKVWIKGDWEQVEKEHRLCNLKEKKSVCLSMKLLTFKLTTELSVDCLNDLLRCPWSQLLSTLKFPQAAPTVIHHDQSGHK